MNDGSAAAAANAWLTTPLSLLVPHPALISHGSVSKSKSQFDSQTEIRESTNQIPDSSMYCRALKSSRLDAKLRKLTHGYPDGPKGYPCVGPTSKIVSLY